MGPVARCSADDCSGSLAPMFNKDTKEVDDYYCTNCGVVYDRVASDDRGYFGVEPKGRVAEHDEFKLREQEYRQQIADLQDQLRQIDNLIDGDTTRLGKAIIEIRAGRAVPDVDDDEEGVDIPDEAVAE